MHPAMTAATTPDGGPQPPSSLCPTCRLRPRRLHGAYCRECTREWFRERAKRIRLKNTDRTPCPDCGEGPHRAPRCPVRFRAYLIARGRHKINERWPSYGDLLSEDFLKNAGANWPRVVSYPHPSSVFIGIDPTLDHRLMRDHQDKNVTLCQAMAALPRAQQQNYYELYLKDPADAQQWASLPIWKRPIRRGDPDDVRVWKFFTMQRLNMEQAADDVPPWSLRSQGMQLPQMFGGILTGLSLEGIKKLGAVMCAYGLMLGHGEDVGDVTNPPWLSKEKK